MLAILGLRIGLTGIGLYFLIGSVIGCIVWAVLVFSWSRHRKTWHYRIQTAEPLDRDAAAYVASYLLPILAAKAAHVSGYVAYGLAAFLILAVAYRADLGAINPLAYLAGFRAYRVTADGDVAIVLSKWHLSKGEVWKVQGAVGLAVARQHVEQANEGE
jgi:hypothetical protein